MANAITGIRLACALLLMFCPTFSGQFYLLYLVGGVSDVLDGWIARRRKTETKNGARLDTAADLALFGVVLVKMWRAVTIPLWLEIWILCIAALKCCNLVSGFLRYRRFVTEHTVLNKICGGFLFVIPLCIGHFPRQPVAVLVMAACAVATAAAVQEGHYIRMGKEIS